MDLFIFKHAFQDFVRPKRIIIWLLVAAGLFGLSKVFQGVNHELVGKELYGTLSSILVFHVLPLLAAIYTTAVIGGEVEQKTIVYLLTRPIPRTKLILWRTAAAALVVAILGWICAILVSAAVFGGGLFGNGLLYRDFMAIGIGAAAYCGLFLLISLMVNKAMVVCLIYAFGWEAAIPNAPGDLSSTSIYSFVQSIADHPPSGDMELLSFLSGTLSPSLRTPTAAVVALVGLTVVTLVLSALWFSRFEFNPREDAG